TAFSRPDVAAQLKLTEAQKSQIAAIQQKSRDAMRASMQGVDFRNMSPQDRQTMGAKFRAAQEDTNSKILAILSPSQKKQWNAMKGEPFKSPAPAPRQNARR